jgi:hypothetical protein
MMGRGELPVVRIGRCVRVSRTALSIWIDERIEQQPIGSQTRNGGVLH